MMGLSALLLFGTLDPNPTVRPKTLQSPTLNPQRLNAPSTEQAANDGHRAQLSDIELEESFCPKPLRIRIVILKVAFEVCGVCVCVILLFADRDLKI